jgi:hypothetical protein
MVTFFNFLVLEMLHLFIMRIHTYIYMVNLSSFLLVVKFLAVVYIHHIYLAPLSFTYELIKAYARTHTLSVVIYKKE